MPRDYRKRTGSRSAKAAPSSNFGWVVFGILIGLFLAIMLYWKINAPKHHHDHAAPPAKVAAKTHAAETNAPKAEGGKSSTTAAATPEFDFYTVLPKMQVANNGATAAAPASPPPPRPPAPVSTTTAPVATAETAASVATTAPSAAATKPVVATTPTTTPSEPVVAAETVPPTSVSHKTKVAVATPPAKTTTAAMPVATETKPPIAKGVVSNNYLLQMASLKSYAEADRLKAELTIMGFDVYIQPYTVKGQVYNRVVMGPYPSKSAALRQQAQMRKDHVSSVLIKAP